MAMDVGRRGGAIAAINVTPMADVMIVLLVIFMVTLPVITSEKVRLPEAARSRAEKDESKALVLELDEQGRLAIDHRAPIPRPAALAEIAELAAADPLRPIVVKADRETSYTTVTEVLDACREAGAETVALAVSAPPGSEAR